MYFRYLAIQINVSYLIVIVCISTKTPKNLPPAKTPQFVILSFDDSITEHNYEDYYEKIFTNRKNPNGCPIVTTYFVCHEYTSYQLVHKLYKNNQEIGMHSISHNHYTEYWRNLDIEGNKLEFSDQRKMTAKFANIPSNVLKGVRAPHLQMSGDNLFKMLKTENFTYDFSWPTIEYSSPGLWPYTLDYPTTQDCLVKPCPKETHSGVWVFPISTWKDLLGYPSTMLDAAHSIPTTNSSDLLKFFITNFERLYLTNKAPFTVSLHSAWFDKNTELHYKTYLQFIDYLLKKPDVYILGPSQIIEWVKNPIELDLMKKQNCTKIDGNLSCSMRTCELKKDGEEWGERYLKICGNCPVKYPWLKNPLGEATKKSK